MFLARAGGVQGELNRRSGIFGGENRGENPSAFFKESVIQGLGGGRQWEGVGRLHLIYLDSSED